MVKCDLNFGDALCSNCGNILYFRGKVEMSTVGMGIEIGKDVKVRVPYHKIATIELELPTLLTRSYEGDTRIKELKLFFSQENGSIAVSHTICTTHQVDLVLSSREKQFEKTFLDSLLGLQKASDVG